MARFLNRRKAFRVYIASDIHGAEGTWRKYINALRARVYEADAGLYAGDLTGKALVPVMREGDLWTAELSGHREIARDENELLALARRIADRGYYTHVCDVEEWSALSRDPGALDALIRSKAVERVQAWMDLADERLADGGPPVVLIPGNDDDTAIDAALSNARSCTVADGRRVQLDGFEVLGFSASQPTP